MKNMNIRFQIIYREHQLIAISEEITIKLF